MSKTQYFATLETDKLIPELIAKVEKFHDWTEKTGEARKWQKSYNLYYGNHVSGSDNTQVANVGVDQELTAFGVNHYRNLVKHVLALTCSTKSSYDFRAINSDTRSLQQARMADSICDSYLVEKRMFRHMKMAAEMALVLKAGYVYEPWDTTKGKPIGTDPIVDPDTNEPVMDDVTGEPKQKIRYEGDVDMMALAPWHVIYDINLKDWAKRNWNIVRTYENKFDVAARHAFAEDKIIGLSTKDITDKTFWTKFSARDVDEDSDLIPVYYFYHTPTASVPAGRFTKFLADGTNLFDGPFQYTQEQKSKSIIPIHRIVAGERFDSADAYSDFYDIMVLQTVVNTLYSTIFSNEQAFGTQFIWLPEGCNLSEDSMQEGLAFLKGGMPGTEPKALQLTASPTEIFKNIDYIEKAMEKLSGVNSVVRGDPESSLKSGVSLGRLQAMAIQYNSNFQQSWAEIQEDCGTGLLFLLQLFADTERMVAMAGKAQRGAMQSFTNKDIDLIDRVTCDLGNPLSRVYAGRMDMADKFLDKGLIKDPLKYIELTQTGSIEPVTQSAVSKVELIQKENEMLLDGKMPRAMVGDTHIEHVQEHRTIIDDPWLREKADQGDQMAATIVQNALAHIMEHKNIQMTQDPFWFVVSGEPMPPPPPMPMGPPPPGMNGPPPGPGGPPPPPGPNGPMPPQPGMNEPAPPPIPPLPPEVMKPGA